MGVKPLFAWLKKMCPHAFRKVHISMFRNTRIPIDATLLCHSFLSSAYSILIDHVPDNQLLLDKEHIFTEKRCNDALELAILRMRSLLVRFFQNQITPILVFDGISAPEKTCARKKRIAQRELHAQKILELKQEIQDILGISGENLNDPFISLIKSSQAKDSFDKLRARYKNANLFDPKSEIDKIKKYTESILGVACVIAPDEAEKYCAYLASTGFASASFTRDSDSLAFGAPILATELEFDDHFKCVFTPIILKTLGLTKHQFVDLCILFGCDFNESIPKLGPVGSWKIMSHTLKKFPNSERIIEHALDSAHEVLKKHETVGITANAISDLNIDRCRFIFLDTSVMSCMTPKFSPIRVDLKQIDMIELMQKRGVIFCPPDSEKVLSSFKDETKLFSSIGEDIEFTKAVNNCPNPVSVKFK